MKAPPEVHLLVFFFYTENQIVYFIIIFFPPTSMSANISPSSYQKRPERCIVCVHVCFEYRYRHRKCVPSSPHFHIFTTCGHMPGIRKLVQKISKTHLLWTRRYQMFLPVYIFSNKN